METPSSSLHFPAILAMSPKLRPVILASRPKSSKPVMAYSPSCLRMPCASPAFSVSPASSSNETPAAIRVPIISLVCLLVMPTLLNRLSTLAFILSNSAMTAAPPMPRWNMADILPPSAVSFMSSSRCSMILSRTSIAILAVATNPLANRPDSLAAFDKASPMPLISFLTDSRG